MAERQLILASNSPRRRELLGLCKLPSRVIPADVDEHRFPGETPLLHVQRLAETKARAVAERVCQGAPADLDNLPGGCDLVLAADTIVVDGETVLGKPANPQEAAQMLRRLRGRVHFVLTAMVLLRPADGVLLRELCQTRVPMRAYREDEIEAYIATGDPLDKAGAYAIQHVGFHPVESLQGCFASVMGLPLCHLTRALKRLDFAPPVDIPLTCQQALNYACPIYRSVLSGEDIG